MTPRSSWWQSTAERGGGIVCWLETLRALLASRPARPVVFTANTGHELGHLGLDDFIARRPGWDRNAARGRRALGALRRQYRRLRRGAVAGVAECRIARTGDGRDGARRPEHALAPPDLVPSGETRDIHRAGGRYLTLVGSNPLFHLPQDRWPDAVDVAAIVRIAAAASRIVLALRAELILAPRRLIIWCTLPASPRRQYHGRTELVAARRIHGKLQLRLSLPLHLHEPAGAGDARSLHGADGVPHRRGKSGATRLDGLKFAFVIRSGKVMADGNWVFGVVVDEAAGPDQRQALGAIAERRGRRALRR